MMLRDRVHNRPELPRISLTGEMEGEAGGGVAADNRD